MSVLFESNCQVMNFLANPLCIYNSDEGSNAEVGQLITAGHFVSFLTPDMALKNDARHGIGLS